MCPDLRPTTKLATIPCVGETTEATPHIRTGSVVCLGTFDGVHRGHQEILKKGRVEADRVSLPLWVVTFHPHPRSVISPDDAPQLLTMPEERLALLGHYGADGVVSQRFDKEIASLSANQFLSRRILADLKCKRIVIGYDFAVGKNREGGKDYIKDWGAKLQVGVSVVDLQKDQFGDKIGSGAVRNAMHNNNFNKAVELMGHPYPVSGQIVTGLGKGKEIGYPTWNIALPEVKLPPPVGVYAGWTNRPTPRPGMAYFGTNPTFGGQAPRLEVNILDGSGEERTPGEVECFWLTDFIRPEIAFENPADLVTQLADDEREVRHRLKI